MAATTEPRPPSRRRRQVLALLAAWFVTALAATAVVFLSSEREVNIASHDSVVRPDLSGRVTLLTGPVLPDLRLSTGYPVGLEVQLGKTDAGSTEELVQRYTAIGSQPEGQIDKLTETVTEMVRDAALRGAVIGLVPLALWGLFGARRRAELRSAVLSRRGGAVALLVAGAVGTAAVLVPWRGAEPQVVSERPWESLAEYLDGQIAVPQALDGVEIRGDVTTNQTRRLIESAFVTYDVGEKFYSEAVDAAAELEGLREPAEGETVVALIADRHDNIGMDEVARAVADRAGATGVLNAGDDTATGASWEAFSIDSVSAAFDGYDRWAVLGNHDSGDFVADALDDDGWRVLEGEIVDGPAGGRILGVADPRSSGLGIWRDETGLSFGEVGSLLADTACEANAAGERIDTVLVHDTNLAREALGRGCVDLVVGGHTHVQDGPDLVPVDDPEADAESGVEGHRYVNGTTGGAAYALAIGSKLRRTAQISLITYDEDGSAVAIQGVDLRTDGRFLVQEPVEIADEELDFTAVAAPR